VSEFHCDRENAFSKIFNLFSKCIFSNFHDAFSSVQLISGNGNKKKIKVKKESQLLMNKLIVDVICTTVQACGCDLDFFIC
jgi:hypothetical protein